jgi:hypothetical protein
VSASDIDCNWPPVDLGRQRSRDAIWSTHERLTSIRRPSGCVLARTRITHLLVRMQTRHRSTRGQPTKSRAGVTLATVRRLALAFPHVEEGISYGTPGFRVGKKFLARLWEDGETLVIKCGDDERDLRMKADPDTFFITDHYRGYPTVLVRLSRVTEEDLKAVLEEAWRRQAPKRLVKEYDQSHLKGVSG